MTEELKGAEETKLAEGSPVEETPPATPEGVTETQPISEEDAKQAAADLAVQGRINKVVAERGAAQRENEDLRRKVDELSAKITPVETNTSSFNKTVEDFGYDDEAYNKAFIQHEVSEGLKTQEHQSQANEVARKERELATSFNTKASEFAVKNPDYQETVNSIPALPQDTLNALRSMENGPQMAHYLGKHLDVAYEIASLPPVTAAIRLGQIGQGLITNTKQITTSSAPEPPETIGSGGSVNKKMEDMSMDEIYAQK